MDIGQYNQNYGLFCLCHSKLYDGKTIDKLTFTVPRHYFRKNIFRNKNKISNERFYIENCNNQFAKLHLHGEYINPLIPMFFSVMELFYFISLSHVFMEEMNQKIRRILEKCNYYNNGNIEFIRFLNTNDFKFSELELAFDFFGCLPFEKIKEKEFKNYQDSVYTYDYKIYFRKVFKEDDSLGSEKDRIRDSIFIIYNRGNKLEVQEKIWRVEWRLRDERSRRLLDITDLRLNMDSFIYEKGYRMKKIFNYWVPANSILFNWEYIKYHFPVFAVLVAE